MARYSPAAPAHDRCGRARSRGRIADAKGCDEDTVRLRCKLHETLPDSARRACSDGVLDEGHVQAISSVVLTSEPLAPWLTTEQAQAELVREVLGKHRGGRAEILLSRPPRSG